MRAKRAENFRLRGGPMSPWGGLKILGMGGDRSSWGGATPGWGGVPPIPPILDNPAPKWVKSIAQTEERK